MKRFIGLCFSSLIVLSPLDVLAQTAADKEKQLKQGQYIVTVAGCNDCHTPDYARRGGRIDLDDWLVGNDIGFKGVWGITYASNLRLYFDAMTEDQWVDKAKEFKTRPPMSWFAIRNMREEDLRAVYAFIVSLGKKGDPVPDYTPRGESAKTSFVDFMPQSVPEAVPEAVPESGELNAFQ